MGRESRGSPILSSAVSRARVAACRKRIYANRGRGWRGEMGQRKPRKKSGTESRFGGSVKIEPADLCGDPDSSRWATYNIKLTRRLFTRCRGAAPGRGCYRQLHAGARSRNELFRERRAATNGKKGVGRGEISVRFSLVEGKYCRWHHPLLQKRRNEGRNASVITRTETKLRIVWSTIALTG